MGRNKMFVVDSMVYNMISRSIRISSDCLGICHFPGKERNVIERNYKQYDYKWCTLVVEQLLRHCATNRKVAGSMLDGITGIFN